jgi:hypothetical protein
MSSEMDFKGRLEYGSRAILDTALDQVRGFLGNDEEDLLEVFEDQWDTFFGVDGAALDVDIQMSGPADWWFAIETALAILTEDASDGFVDGRQEGAPGKTRYLAGGEEQELG